MPLKNLEYLRINRVLLAYFSAFVIGGTELCLSLNLVIHTKRPTNELCMEDLSRLDSK